MTSPKAQHLKSTRYPISKDLELALSLVPNHMRGGVENYLLYRLPPGGFLFAVLCNDLMHAAAKADEANLAKLADWARVLYWLSPSVFGSPEIVRAWIAGPEEKAGE